MERLPKTTQMVMGAIRFQTQFYLPKVGLINPALSLTGNRETRWNEVLTMRREQCFLEFKHEEMGGKRGPW